MGVGLASGDEENGGKALDRDDFRWAGLDAEAEGKCFPGGGEGLRWERVDASMGTGCC